MAKALAIGLKDKYDLCIVARNENSFSFFKEYGIQTSLYDGFDIDKKDILLAFKPYALNDMSKILQGEARILISVLAGVKMENLKSIKAKNYARIMPNIAAKYKKSTTSFILENNLFKDEILDIIKTFGDAFELEKEELFDPAMLISGCAPAFLSLVAESIANAGLCEGLKNELSYELTISLFHGFAELLEREHPALIKEQICSPAGVTIKGVKALEEEGLRYAFFKAFAAALKK